MSTITPQTSKEQLFLLVKRFIENVSQAKTINQILSLKKQITELFFIKDVPACETEDSNIEFESVSYAQTVNTQKQTLLNQLTIIRNSFYNCGIDLNRVERKIEDIIKSEIIKDKPVKVDIPDTLIPGKLKTFTVFVGRTEYKSTLLVLDIEYMPHIFIPEMKSWVTEKGINPPMLDNISQIQEYVWIDLTNMRERRLKTTFFRNRFIISTGSGYDSQKTERIKTQRTREQNRFIQFLKIQEP